MPAIAPRSLRGQGTTHTAVDGAAGFSGPAATSTVRLPRPARSPAVRPAGDGDPHAGDGEAVRGEHLGDGLAEGRRRRTARAGRGRGRAAEPGRWRRTAKGWPSMTLRVSKTPSPTVRPWSKTETVASPPVDQRSRCTHDLLGHRHDPDATRRRWRAFSSVSAHSPSGSESQVMPPPVPKWSSLVLEPERADGDVEVALPSVGVDPADRAAVDAARHGLERGDVLEGGQLRRTGDRPGREGGVDGLGPAAARAQPALDRGHEVDEARGAARRRAARAPRPTRTRTPGRGRCGPGRRSSRSRPGPWAGGRRGSAAVPLMGDDRTAVAVAPEEALGRRRRDVARRAPGAAPPREYGAGLPSASAAPRAATSAPAGQGRREPPGEVHLVDVAAPRSARGWRARRP